MSFFFLVDVRDVHVSVVLPLTSSTSSKAPIAMKFPKQKLFSKYCKICKSDFKISKMPKVAATITHI